MKSNRRNLRPKALIVALATGVQLLAMSSAALAAPPIVQVTNGTLACRGTTTAGSASFYYNNMYLWNNGASTQFLTCVLPDWNTGNSGDDTYIAMNWAAGATGGTVTCTAQVGAFYNGVSNVAVGSTRNLVLAANANAQIVYPNPMTHTAKNQSVNIVCSVPPSFKLGLIEHWRTSPNWLESFCGNFGNPLGCENLTPPP